MERKHRDLKVKLAIAVKSDHKTWDDAIPTIRWAMNTSHSENARQSAFMQAFDQSPRSPSDNLMRFLTTSLDPRFLKNTFTDFLLQTNINMQEVRERLELAKDVRRSKHNESCNTRTYRVGD